MFVVCRLFLCYIISDWKDVNFVLYQITDGTLSIGSEMVLSHFNFEIHGTEKIALIGKNGTGKTTFLRFLAGELELDRDDKREQPPVVCARILTTGMLSQHVFEAEEGQMSVREHLWKTCPVMDTSDKRYFVYEQEYNKLFTGFGFSMEEQQKRISEFSGGEQTKIAFIQLLLAKPDLLLLDEPTNHLDIETVEWLEQYLRNYEKAVIMVSHDRFFLDEVADTVYEISGKKMTRYVGNYSEFRKQKKKNYELQLKAYESQQEEIARLEELMKRFKNKPNKAAFARSRKKLLERMERIEKPERESYSLITGDITPLELGAKWVLETEKMKIGYDKPLLELTLRIRRGQKIGVIGANGVGKSAFLKTIAGLLHPIQGKYIVGNHVTIGYFDQQTAELQSEKTVVEHFHDNFPVLTEKEVRSILGAYLFSGKDARKKVSQLSGGEKSRLVLAELLQSRPNFLILDEPTNHMDIQAKEAMECALRAYTGTLLFVSHDRYFIDQIADALFIFEKGEVLYYPFSYRHYMEHCKRNIYGESISAIRTAEQQALIAGLQSVPKKEYHETKQLSSDEAYDDWKMRLADDVYKEWKHVIEHLWDSFQEEEFWSNIEYRENFEKKREIAEQKWTESCIEWYDSWMTYTGDNMEQ